MISSKGQKKKSEKPTLTSNHPDNKPYTNADITPAAKSQKNKTQKMKIRKDQKKSHQSLTRKKKKKRLKKKEREKKAKKSGPDINLKKSKSNKKIPKKF